MSQIFQEFCKILRKKIQRAIQVFNLFWLICRNELALSLFELIQNLSDPEKLSATIITQLVFPGDTFFTEQ